MFPYIEEEMPSSSASLMHYQQQQQHYSPSSTRRMKKTTDRMMIEMHPCKGKSSHSSTIERRLKLLKRHLNIPKWIFGNDDHKKNHYEDFQNNNPNESSKEIKISLSSSSPKKQQKSSRELLLNLFHFSKWMLIVTGATPCLIITFSSRIIRNLGIAVVKQVLFPLLRLKDQLVAQFIMTSNHPSIMPISSSYSLSEKEQLFKDYIILSHLYLIHPIIVFFCKLFFWALFNKLTVLYESEIARNLQQLNAFEYYKLINNENPNVKVSKSLTLKEEQLIKQNGPYIFAIGNQRSLADGIVELAYKTQNSVTIMNIEMALFPFFGWISYGVGSEVIIRQLPNQSWNVLDHMRKTMKRGLFQTYIYPEGARQTSDSRELLPYKMGLFMLAIETQASIVPVIHYGIDDIWPYDDWRIYSGNQAFVVIGEPISTKGIVLNQRFELMEMYRTRIKEMIQRLEERKEKNQIDHYYKKL
ncbi:hypothetical protein FDP41_005009 [Naegleria fowleri]|uniref:Phospholipid/glycerol acyltransferase domain-containing protein n=1 Tax=Naegleria fowleri TaxID=5763 RepID=A0A6A5BLF7_NAEFO|nr:uncharacterized protein FDP41_005009 [Naegleria fowleri]KAF0975682.1 hypothetical protein FDP41_005009 [Naegleria fowleri]